MPETAPRHRDDCITLSEADPFTLTGLVLFGARWKAPLARTLGVSRETVSRWVSAGDIPKWARNTVALLNAGKGSVLSLCDRTGNMVRPWAEAGFECFCVDVRHEPSQTRRGAVTWIGADIREWLPPPRRYAIGRMLEHTMEGKMPSSSAAKSYLPPGLHQTNVRGVYAFGSAPAGFDPKSAKRDELIRNGFPPRPGRRSPPSHLAAWKRMFEVPERTFRRVAGDLTPGRRVMSPTGPIDNQTQAWSGIVVESSPGGPVQGCNSVWGTLQMPGGVTSSTLETSLGVIICLCSAWVGLDGWNYVEGAPPATGPCQTGVDILLAGFPGNQNTSYKGWIEWNMDSKLNATSPYLQPYYVPVDVNANDVIS